MSYIKRLLSPFASHNRLFLSTPEWFSASLLFYFRLEQFYFFLLTAGSFYVSIGNLMSYIKRLLSSYWNN